MRVHLPFFNFTNSGKHFNYSNNASIKKDYMQENGAHCVPLQNNDTNKNETYYASLQNDDIKENNSENNFYIDIFGIKLQSDDLLLLAILFFLYEEKVEDMWLYITLILLLLS